MIDEYRCSISIISWKCEDGTRYILVLSRFWIVDTNDIEPIESYPLISEYAGRCMSESAECSLNSEIRLMIAICIYDTMTCSHFTEWIEEVLQASVHPVEEVSCDTEEFYIFSINFLHDIAEILGSIDMSDVHIRYECDFFLVPICWEIFDADRYIFDNSVFCSIESISREAEGWYHSDESDERYRYVYPKILKKIYSYPHGKYCEWEEMNKAEPYGCYIIESPSESCIMVACYPGREKKENREHCKNPECNAGSEKSESEKMYYRVCEKIMHSCQESLDKEYKYRHCKYVGWSVHEKSSQRMDWIIGKSPKIEKVF